MTFELIFSVASVTLMVFVLTFVIKMYLVLTASAARTRKEKNKKDSTEDRENLKRIEETM